MGYVLSLIMAFLWLLSEVAHGQGTRARLKPNIVINPTFEIPQAPEKYSWKLKLQTGDTSKEILVYEFEDTGYRRPVGTLPIGTPIELLEVRRVSKRNFYAVPFQRPPQPGQVAAAPGAKSEVTGPTYWVDGFNVELVGPKTAAEQAAAAAPKAP